MKRTPLARSMPLKRSGRVKPKRATPRRREAPRWDRAGWEAARVMLAARSGGACEICGTHTGPFERHHRKRRRDGGDRLCNILYLCRRDHAWVTEHPAMARKYGWIVSVSRDPSQIPVLWRRTQWKLLDDTGGMTDAFSVIDAHA